MVAVPPVLVEFATRGLPVEIVMAAGPHVADLGIAAGCRIAAVAGRRGSVERPAIATVAAGDVKCSGDRPGAAEDAGMIDEDRAALAAAAAASAAGVPRLAGCAIAASAADGGDQADGRVRPPPDFAGSNAEHSARASRAAAPAAESGAIAAAAAAGRAAVADIARCLAVDRGDRLVPR